MFNEAAVLRATIEEVKKQLAQTGLSAEIICVNDGSSDGTGRTLDDLAAQDEAVVPLHLTRNFGKEAAMAAGLDHSRGRAVLILDADLQHPPSLIPQMVDKWRTGADVVNGVKLHRGREGFVYKTMAAVFNYLMGGALMGSPAGNGFRGASDFKLLDRQVVDAIQACPERHRFFRGLVAWVGFRVVDLPFEVQERVAGETKWSVGALVRYSIKNLLAFSALPLRLIALAGFSMLTLTGLLAAWTLYRYVRGDVLEGFPTVIMLQLIFGSVLLTCLGVISLYLAEMYDELKRRPVYVYRLPDPERDERRSSAQRNRVAPAGAPHGAREGTTGAMPGKAPTGMADTTLAVTPDGTAGANGTEGTQRQPNES